jgi:hypothetical protein
MKDRLKNSVRVMPQPRMLLRKTRGSGSDVKSELCLCSDKLSNQIPGRTTIMAFVIVIPNTRSNEDGMNLKHSGVRPYSPSCTHRSCELPNRPDFNYSPYRIRKACQPPPNRRQLLLVSFNSYNQASSSYCFSRLDIALSMVGCNPPGTVIVSLPMLTQTVCVSISS